MRRILFAFAYGSLTVFALLIMSALFDTQKADAPMWVSNYFEWLTIWPLLALFHILYPDQEPQGLTKLGFALALFLSALVYSAIVYAAATITSRRLHNRYS